MDDDVSKIKTLVLSGGGMKGIAHIGVLEALTEFDFKFENCIGCSIGSIVGLLYILKFEPKEIKEIILNLDIDELFDINLDKFNELFGFDSGIKLLSYLKFHISEKYSVEFVNSLTLKKLYDFNKIHYTIVTTCLNNQSVVELNYINFPNLNVFHAIRMSISIPLLFTSVKWNGLYYVDGGLLENYPYKLIKQEPEFVIGVDLHTSKENPVLKIDSIDSFIYSLYKCVQKKYNQHSFTNQTIFLDLNEYSPLDFSMERSRKEELIDIGYKETLQYILTKFFFI